MIASKSINKAPKYIPKTPALFFLLHFLSKTDCKWEVLAAHEMPA